MSDELLALAAAARARRTHATVQLPQQKLKQEIHTVENDDLMEFPHKNTVLQPFELMPYYSR